jgi:hypothetical protein
MPEPSEQVAAGEGIVAQKYAKSATGGNRKLKVRSIAEENARRFPMRGKIAGISEEFRAGIYG